MPEVDHYAALDLTPAATSEEIGEARRFLLLAYHPDRFRDAGQRARAEELAKRVNAAWEVLGEEATRAAYDRRRAATPPPAPDAPPPRRAIPCPSCATVGRVPDGGGRLTGVSCPACGEQFMAIIGARCVRRPRLERKGIGMRYEAVLAAADGSRRTVSFRTLPKELALSEGELMSVVLHPRRSRPVYAIVHTSPLDLGWRVR